MRALLRDRLPPEVMWRWLRWGSLAAATGLLLRAAVNLFRAGTLLHLDNQILVAVARFRTPLLTGVMLNLTALSSFPVVALFSLVGVVLCLLRRDRFAALQIGLASAGAGMLMEVLKNLVDRERPDVVPRLVEAYGLSYPSGHSFVGAAFYLTIALLGFRAFRTHRTRTVLVAMAALVSGIVAFSRVYLGVHYPTDVVSGLFFGSAWALVLAFSLTYVTKRINHERLH
jgi:undecaprenyl-diphosphatase